MRQVISQAAGAVLCLFAVVAPVFVASVSSAASWDSATSAVTVCTSTGTSTNVTVPAGSYIVGICDAAAYVGQSSQTQSDGGPTCVNQDGGSIPICELRAANKPFYIRMGSRDTKLACISVSGTANCNLFRAND